MWWAGAVTATSEYPVLLSRRGEPAILPPSSARSLLLTIAGEMLREGREGVWTTALMQVLAGFGVEDHAARQLLSRSASAGWFERERVGRAVRWHLAPRGWELVREGVRRSESYLAPHDTWDGEWLVLFVTVPQQQRTTRKRLYGGLTWLGMGNPTPGVWVTPHTERVEALTRLVSALDLEGTALSIVGTMPDVGMTRDQLVMRAWDLSELESSYKRFLKAAGGPEPRTPDDVMLCFFDLLNLQQRYMRLDPQLPAAMVPDWVGRDAAEVFRRLRERWGAPAHERFWQIVSEYAPG